MKKTIAFKIVLSIVSVSLLVAISMVSILEFRNDKTIDLLSDINIKQGEKVVISLLEEEKANVLAIAKEYSNNIQLIKSFKSRDYEKISKDITLIFKSLNADNGITIFELGDTEGIVYIRAHNLEKSGDDKSDNSSITKALQG